MNFNTAEDKKRTIDREVRRIPFTYIEIVGQQLHIETGIAVTAVGNDDRRTTVTDVSRRPACPTLRENGVIARGKRRLDGRMSFPLSDVVDQLACDGQFRFGSFAKRNANGIADAVAQQRTDAYGTFDAPVFAVARFGHAQMEWVVHPFGIHRAYQQADCFDHDYRVGCFDGDDHVVELLVPADTQKLHARGNHPFGRITVAAHDAVGQRAVINADANGCPVLSADGKERDKAVAYLLDFGGILLVGVSQLVECLEAVPGLMRTFSTVVAATSAARGLKWMSATSGVV